MSWTEPSSSSTSWESLADSVILNNRFVNYDTPGLSYDTTGVTYDWKVSYSASNVDLIWGSITDSSSAWSTVSDTSGGETVVLTTQGSPMGLGLILTYAETTTTTTPLVGPATTQWGGLSDSSTSWTQI